MRLRSYCASINLQRLLLFASIGLFGSLQAIELTTIDKKSLAGDLKFIQQGRILLKGPTGRNLRTHFNQLDKKSQTLVQSIISKNGGNLEFYSWMTGDPKSFKRPWPKTVRGKARPTVKRMTSKWSNGRYVYESTNYEFITNAKLDAGLILKCATLFEATYTMNAMLPLNINGVHRTGDRKFRIYIHETRADYIRAGGPSGSGGVYMPATEDIHIPLTSMGVMRQGKRYVENNEMDYRTISHEVTHQMMEGILKAAWFIEGSAEYVSHTPYTYPATFQAGSSIKPYHKSITQVLGRKINFPSLKTFMNLNYSQFSQGGAENYSRALMLTYYFYLLDSDKSRIKDYISILQSGAAETTAQPKLLDGRSYKQLEAEFIKAWKKHGINVQFPKS